MPRGSLFKALASLWNETGKSAGASDGTAPAE